MTIQHVSEDTLIEMTLGLLNAEQLSGVRTHLDECSRCRKLFDDVERTLTQIKNVKLEVPAEIPNLPAFSSNAYRWLRVAAMVAVGFGLGFVASESLHSPSISVVRQQIDPMPPKLPAVGFVACQEVDLSPSRW